MEQILSGDKEGALNESVIGDDDENAKKPRLSEDQPVSSLRFLILALVSIVLAAVYALLLYTSSVISCEQPLPLQKEITRDLGISNTQYTVLLAVYTFPNILFPVIGGWIFDAFGRG